MDNRHSQTLVRLAHAQSPVESDPRVLHALVQLLACGGDVEVALEQLAPRPPDWRGEGIGDAVLELVAEVLVNDRESAAALDEYRRALVTEVAHGVVQPGRITAAAELLARVADLEIDVATLVFLCSIPIGVEIHEPMAATPRGYSAVE
jgi:hypothetical protein